MNGGNVCFFWLSALLSLLMAVAQESTLVETQDSFCNQKYFHGVYFDGRFLKFVKIVTETFHKSKNNNKTSIFSFFNQIYPSYDASMFYRVYHNYKDDRFVFYQTGEETIESPWQYFLYSGFHLPFAKITVDMFHVRSLEDVPPIDFYKVWYNAPEKPYLKNSVQMSDEHNYYRKPQKEFGLCSGNYATKVSRLSHRNCTFMDFFVSQYCCYGKTECTPNRLFDVEEQQNSMISAKHRCFLYHPEEKVLMHVSSNVQSQVK